MGAVNDELLGVMLIQIGKRIRAGKCELSQEQADRIFSEIEGAIDVQISKEEACSLLGVSRSTFDSRVASGEIPEGRHARGFKEKRWSKRDILKYKDNGKD